jgi:hypothetical protein
VSVGGNRWPACPTAGWFTAGRLVNYWQFRWLRERLGRTKAASHRRPLASCCDISGGLTGGVRPTGWLTYPSRDDWLTHSSCWRRPPDQVGALVGYMRMGVGLRSPAVSHRRPLASYCERAGGLSGGVRPTGLLTCPSRDDWLAHLSCWRRPPSQVRPLVGYMRTAVGLRSPVPRKGECVRLGGLTFFLLSPVPSSPSYLHVFFLNGFSFSIPTFNVGIRPVQP